MQNTIFEELKNINEYGAEYWYARDLQEALKYTKWGNFVKVIDKAKKACENSGFNTSEHFADVGKTIKMPKGATKTIADFILSRYACYLIVQNADPRKEVVALGQTYFAVQTRKQEIDEEFNELSEDQKRLKLRTEMKTHNKQLAAAAKDAGVESKLDYATFQNSGYKGLYGGLTAKDIQIKKGLSSKQPILDYMGTTELAANLFRATQTEEKLKRENIKDKQEANDTHFEVGQVVRNTIKQLGGTMPEDLPTHENIKQVEKRVKKQNKLESNKIK